MQVWVGGWVVELQRACVRAICICSLQNRVNFTNYPVYYVTLSSWNVQQDSTCIGDVFCGLL